MSGADRDTREYRTMLAAPVRLPVPARQRARLVACAEASCRTTPGKCSAAAGRVARRVPRPWFWELTNPSQCQGRRSQEITEVVVGFTSTFFWASGGAGRFDPIPFSR